MWFRNCAPVNITGGTGNLKLINDLPDIFVANYPGDPDVPNCVTGTLADKVVLNIPNPGKYGRVLAEPMEPALKPVNYCTQIPPALSLPTFQPDPRTVFGGSSSSASLPATSFPALPSSSFDSTTSTSVSTISPTSSFYSESQGQGDTTAALATSNSPKVSFTSTTTVTVTGHQSSPSSAAASTTGNPNKGIHGSTNSTTSEALVVIPITNSPKTRTKNTTATTAEFPACTPSPRSSKTSHLRLPPRPSTLTLVTSSSNPTPTPAPASPYTSTPTALTTLSTDEPSDKAVRCPTHGALVCLAGNMFGVCSWGWAVPQALAAGTRCVEGKIVRRGEDGERAGRVAAGAGRRRVWDGF